MKPVAFPQVQLMDKVLCPLLFRLVLLVKQRRKLRSFRGCCFSTSSFRFLLWCRGRFPWSSSGPRCFASWPVWTRRNCSAFARLGLLGLTMSLALCSSCCLRPKLPVIMAGMDPRTVWRFTGAVLGQGFLHAHWCAQSGVMVQTVQYTIWRFRSFSSSRSSTPPIDAQWQFPMVLTFQLIIEIPQFVFGGRCPCLQVFHRCSRG